MENAIATETMTKQEIPEQPLPKKAMPKKMINSYLSNQITGLSKGQLLLTVYDIAITGCQQEDGDKAIRAISELISALNFNHQEISVGLFRLYQYTIDQIRNNNFEESLKVLQDLRETWAIALKNSD